MKSRLQNSSAHKIVLLKLAAFILTPLSIQVGNRQNERRQFQNHRLSAAVELYNRLWMPENLASRAIFYKEEARLRMRVHITRFVSL